MVYPAQRGTVNDVFVYPVLHMERSNRERVSRDVRNTCNGDPAEGIFSMMCSLAL